MCCAAEWPLLYSAQKERLQEASRREGILNPLSSLVKLTAQIQAALRQEIQPSRVFLMRQDCSLHITEHGGLTQWAEHKHK